MSLIQTARVHLSLATTDFGPISLDLSGLGKKVRAIKEALDPLMDGRGVNILDLASAAKALGREATSLAGLAKKLAEHGRLNLPSAQPLIDAVSQAQDLRGDCLELAVETLKNFNADDKRTVPEEAAVAVYDKARNLLLTLPEI